MRFVLLAAVALAGCDGGDLQCGSTQGFVSGKTAGGATVFARPADGGERVQVTAEPNGAYEINLEGDQDWVLWAELDECFSADVNLSVDACEEYDEDIDIDLDNCMTADKPNLYLYPEQSTEVAVRIEADPRQRIFASDPLYNDGWQGVAHPDGTIDVGGENHGFLFYEITLVPEHVAGLDRSEGWCLPGDRAVQLMADVLGGYGFNERERADFVSAWQVGFPVAEHIAVYPQTQVDHMAGLHIEPALPVQRLWLVAEPAATCHIEREPSVVPFDRTGAHAVEWGVVLPR